MTVLTQHDIANARGTPEFTVIPITTGNQIYIGGLVCQLIGATGRASAGTAATGRRFVGYAYSFPGPIGDGLGVTDGTETVRVAYLDELELTVETSLRTNTTLGLNVFVSDDQTVAGTGVGTAGTQLPVGELVAWVDETGTSKATAWVAIRRFAQANIGV